MKLNISKHSYFYLIGVLLIVSFVFLPTVNREWQMFDERDIFFNESLYPASMNFKEILEIISIYAFKSNVESQNLMFSNIINIRSNPIGNVFYIILSYVFSKNAIYFHLLGILIHLLNSCFIWLIFYKFLEIQDISISKQYKNVISSLFTLVWALHPVNIESVLMGTNWLSLLTYSFCFGLFLYNTSKILNQQYHYSIPAFTTIFLLFVLCIATGEYSFTLPFIVFFSSIAFSKSIKTSLELSIPYIAGFIFYAIYYFSRYSHIKDISYQSLSFTFERTVWLSPQIFTHFLKLFLYPKDLSIFQSNLIPLANSYLSPYSIYSLTIFTIFLILPIVFATIFKEKMRNPFIFLLIYCFLFSTLPFLQIIAPTYCIFAERYCYFPLFFLLLLIVMIISKLQNKRTIITLLLLILISLSTRTIIRLKDWHDSYSLYSSVIKTYKKDVYKGFGLANLGYYFASTNNNKESKKYFSRSIEKLTSEIANLKTNGIEQDVKTLKVYGLDRNTIILNAAFRIASIKFYEFHEEASKILELYKPFIESNIDTAGSSQLDLYAKLLLATEQPDEALQVLKFAKEKYPFSTTIIFSLSNFYLNQRDLVNAEKVINEGLKYYPNYTKILPRAIKLYWLKKDLPNLAKYEYLLGLRTHSIDAYQKSLQIYLSLNQLNKAKKIIDKLLLMDRNNPDTLLLTNKYYSLIKGNNGNQ